VGAMLRPTAEPQARLLIRIPKSLKAKLIELAAREHRSLNKQIEFILERSLRDEMKSETAEVPPGKGGGRHRG
jgi:hypothetical protein